MRILALAILLLGPMARAEDLAPGRRALSIGAALVPGLIVPGTGHLVAGRTTTGKRLALIGGAGLLGALTGTALLFVSGAADDTAGEIITFTACSTGVWWSAVLADLVGVASDGAGRPRRVPDLRLVLGLRYVYDPTFDYRLFSAAAADLRTGALRLSPSAWVALDDANARLRVAGGWRAIGGDSFLELEAALTHHHYDEGFATTTGEVSAGGRLELGGIGADLRGLFSELGVGFGVAATSYDAAGVDPSAVLLARFAFGAHLGDSGEIAFLYEHRHDDFAAGLKIPSVGSGPAGHFGLRAEWITASGWGVLAEVQAGSAWVGGVSGVWER